MSKLRVLKAGTTMLVTDMDSAAEEFTLKAHKAGDAVHEQGVSTHVEEAVVFNPKAEGADRYTWHRDGNRVKVTRTLVTKAKDGTVTREALGTAWRLFDNV